MKRSHDDTKSQPSDRFSHKLTSAAPPGNTLTRASGCPISHMKNSLTAGSLGPIALQDVDLIEKLQHFDREKIPARNVHALGDGAYGHLTITKDMSKYTSAKIFHKVGTQIPFFSRLSGTFTEQGDPETYRDIRGFALKFYTDQGNWDLMTINVPVFNCRDMKVGPDTVHAFKRDPRNAWYNLSQTWDFVATHPEGLFNAMFFFTDFGGNPMSYRTMNTFACNTYSFVNLEEQKRYWIKFNLISTLGVKGLDAVSAKAIAAEEPNFLSRDLRTSIESGNYPKWKLCVQIMDEEEGYKNPITFDCTKVWPIEQYPNIEIGEIEINRGVIDYFAEVEQVAFSPANVIPGISWSPDKLLQGRLFVYDDTQHHRLGPNFKQIWINRSHGVEPNTQYTGGLHKQEVKDKWPHYYPSLLGAERAMKKPDERYREPALKCDGNLNFYDFVNEGTDEDYYGQARNFVEQVLDEMQNEHLCLNLANSLVKVEEKQVVDAVMEHLNKISKKALGSKVQGHYDNLKSGKTPLRSGEVVVNMMMKELAHMKSAGSGGSEMLVMRDLKQTKDDDRMDVQVDMVNSKKAHS